jgi:hypothetical protein
MRVWRVREREFRKGGRGRDKEWKEGKCGKRKGKGIRGDEVKEVMVEGKKKGEGDKIMEKDKWRENKWK